MAQFIPRIYNTIIIKNLGIFLGHYINGELNEEIYIEQPVGFVIQSQEHKVCKLNKSIYGLKQSSRRWYLKFHNEITLCDFTMIDEDHCVYVKRDKDRYVLLSLYVDDILIAGNDLEFVKTIKEWLSSTFEMKNMGETSYILGVKIQRNRSKRLMCLSQEHYIQNLLERFNMKDCNPIDTPYARGEYLSKEMGSKTLEEKEKMSKVPYSSAIGSLMYVMMCTRTDICYVVGMVSHYQANPGMKHWRAVKRILRYLKGTIDYSLCYQGKELRLVGYLDADWARDLDERKSTSRYKFLLNNGVITWRSKKQTCIALSTMEAEFVACSTATQEAMWLRRFLQSLGIVKGSSEPTIVYSNNKAAIAYVKDPNYHGRTKHIDSKNNFIRDITARNEVFIRYIPTREMVADPFIKPIPKEMFSVHVKSLGFRRL